MAHIRIVTTRAPGLIPSLIREIDNAANPVVLIPAQGSAPARVYPFHGSHKEVREQVGDLLTAVETGFYYTKTQY